MTEEGRGPGTGTQLPQIPFAVNFFWDFFCELCSLFPGRKVT
jgi:hypothetical protein